MEWSNSIDDKGRRYLVGGCARHFGVKSGEWGGGVGGGEDLDGGVTWAPVEGVGGAEEGDLWGMKSARQVNGGGVATQADGSLGEESGEGGEIELAGEGDDGVWGMGDDFSEVGVFCGVGSSGEDGD